MTLDAFLAGERPADVAFFIHEDRLSNPAAIEAAETVADGIVVVQPGEDGRSAFQSAVGVDPMGLAQRAMDTSGDIDDDLTGGVCPATDDDPDSEHTAQFIFAFVEAQNEDVGGLYAEGDVLHAYTVCACGEAYSDKWVIDE